MEISDNKAITLRQPVVKLIVGIMMLNLLSGCAYEDFKEDHAYSTVYFANQISKRNFVEDEINTIKIGVVLGGKRVNTKNEWVDFTIQETDGLDNTDYELLPGSYYTLSNDHQFIISSGSFAGEVSMTINPSFFEDNHAAEDHYSLIFKLKDTSADSILSFKDSLLLIIGFESRFFGNYYHNGLTIRKDTMDGSVVDTVVYHQDEPVTNAVNNWSLSTAGSQTVYTKGIANYAPSDLTGFFIRIEDSYSLQIIEDTALISQGYHWDLEQLDEGNYYDPENRKFYLNYAYTDVLTRYRCYATDTLKFRNRILDGVNQWDF